jgi:hypothetical protein
MKGCATRHMLSAVIAVLLFGLLPEVGLNAFSQTVFPTEEKAYSTTSGDLVEVLMSIAETFDVSVVAEIAQPYPVHVQISAGTHGAEELLNLVVQQCSGYAWQKKGSVAWEYSEDVIRSPGDFSICADRELECQTA